ncbi:hypothetical protein PMIN06_002612 [Paraphaeosphaeria minitans]|uniref:MARVEL domain-containing protein n=1 Tax=Paraphaeosphaeria minitans TaxID=565426 RepID=A0A9P6GGW7_9PLEO|nr:hypothetical protein PMIN01_06807 [Paraphaeosphaeria minitans]
MDTVFDVALRATQIVFAFVVLGLSTHLTATALQGSVPFILVWATMVGAATLMTSILGAASNWYERLEGKPMLLIDGCMVAANLAGGTLLAIGVKGAECNFPGIAKFRGNIPRLLLPKVDCADEQTCRSLM